MKQIFEPVLAGIATLVALFAVIISISFLMSCGQSPKVPEPEVTPTPESVEQDITGDFLVVCGDEYLVCINNQVYKLLGGMKKLNPGIHKIHGKKCRIEVKSNCVAEEL